MYSLIPFCGSNVKAKHSHGVFRHSHTKFLRSLDKRIGFFVDTGFKKCYTCSMTEQDIKQNFSKNLIALRKASALTQLQLAEKLSYSDKSISKWECGDVLPDVVTMQMVAEFFGVTVNDLIGSNPPKNTISKNKHLIVTLMSVGLVVLIASLAFLVCSSLSVEHAWMIYIYALPVMAIVAIVLSATWFGIIPTGISVSLLVWLSGLAFYLSILVFAQTSLWFTFIVCLIVQVLVVLWIYFRIIRKKNAAI